MHVCRRGKQEKGEEGSPIQFQSTPFLGASFYSIFTTFCRLNTLALRRSPHLRKTFIRQKEMLEQIGALPLSLSLGGSRERYLFHWALSKVRIVYLR